MSREKAEKDDKENLDFEARQNALGFFDLLLRVAKRNPKLWEQIFDNQEKDNKTVKNK